MDGDSSPHSPAFNRDMRFSSQNVFPSNEASDSLALSSYLKLRQESRASPLHPPNQMPNRKELFEDYRFEESASFEEELEKSDRSENSLIFTENLTEVSELDFKAMRLLVHTSLHEKAQAQAKLSIVEDEVSRLMKLTAKFTSSSNWALPLAIIKKGNIKMFRQKQRCFQNWKDKMIAYRISKLMLVQRGFTLKLARRNILKVRLMHLSRAFNRWTLQIKHAVEAIESYGIKVASNHKSFLLQMAFNAARQRRVRRQTLRQLNRVARAVLFRKCLSRWKQHVSDHYRQHYFELKQAAAFSAAVGSVVVSRQSTKQAFLHWAAWARADRMRSKLSQLCTGRLGQLVGKYVDPVHHAFQQWKQLTTSVYTNLQLATAVWHDAHRKSARFLARKALQTWKDKCGRFRTLTTRIAHYLAIQRAGALRGAFNKLLAARQEHMRTLVKEGVDRWMRQLLRTIDTSAELTCRNVLSARFRHWHHATHTERHATQFKGQLQELHGSLQRTKSSLQEEMAHKKELQQKAHQSERQSRERLVSSKFRYVDRVVTNILQAGKSRGFRAWLRYYHWHQQQESVAETELTERTKRVHGNLIRWLKHIGEANLQFALHTWKFHCRRANKLSHMENNRHLSLCRQVYQRWKRSVSENKLQRKVLKRMFRDKRHAMAHLAWDTWVKKVNHIKNKCKSIIKLMHAKRRGLFRIAFGRWSKGIADESLRWERDLRQRKEEAERVLMLRLYWNQFRFGLSQQRSDNQSVVQMVVAKLMSRMRNGFDRWYQSAKRLTRLRNVCLNLTRVYAHTLGKRHLLCFAKWKAVVWDYQKIGYEDIQRKLAEAQARIQAVTEQQLCLETSAAHLRAHNERADRIARTLYHQVHRMLSSRRLYGMVKLTFNLWKQNHELMRRLKLRLKQYFIRAKASAATQQLASAFRSWVVATHVLAREETARKLKQKNADYLLMRRSFDQWQAYRMLRRMQMLSVIVRLKSGIQAVVAKTLAAAFHTWRTEVAEYSAYRAATLRSCFIKWREDVADGAQKRKALHRLFPKFKAANMRQYFLKWVENTRILRLLCDTIIRMLEVSKLNQTYVSSVRLRRCWSRWYGAVSACNNKIKACRMIVQCYRKILRTALFVWRRNCDQQHSTAQARRMTMKKLLQLARFHALNRFHRWKSTAQKMKVAEEHVNKLGMVLKRLRLTRKKRHSWNSWKTLFRELNSPTTSTSATLKIHGPKYVNAVTRSQYWSSSLLRCVLLSTSLEPVLELALEALSSMLPEFTPSVYYVHHQHEYLWGHATRASASPPYLQQRTPASALSLDHTITAFKQLQLSRRFSPVPRNAAFSSDFDLTDREYFPVAQEHRTQRYSQQQPQYDAAGTPFRVPDLGSSSGAKSPQSRAADAAHTSRSRGFETTDTPFGRGARSGADSPSQHDAGTTILLGEGLVGRCAQQRCMQVYREGVITDGTYSQKRVYCSMNVPVPEHSFNINVNVAGVDNKDPVATAVLPIAWGGNVVAVVQLTAPNTDPLGVFFNADDVSSREQAQGGTYVSQEAKNKAVKHMSAVLRDLVDFSEVNADPDFAASFSVEAGALPQSLLSRARTLRGQMMYQLLQLCIELKLDEEKSVGFMSLVSTLAEVFGRHFPAVRSTAPEAQTSATATPAGLSTIGRSPRKEDVTLMTMTNFSSGQANTSFVGLAHYFAQNSSELQRADSLQHSLLQETEGLNELVEKLKKSRAKYLHKAEVLELELASSLESLEAERATSKKLSHSVKRAEAKLKAFEQQQAEIGKLNNIMRSAAHSALHQK